MIPECRIHAVPVCCDRSLSDTVVCVCDVSRDTTAEPETRRMRGTVPDPVRAVLRNPFGVVTVYDMCARASPPPLVYGFRRTYRSPGRPLH